MPVISGYELLIVFNMAILALAGFIGVHVYYLDLLKSAKEIRIFISVVMLISISVSSGCYLIIGGE